jgi:predicted secreted hydrolase
MTARSAISGGPILGTVRRLRLLVLAIALSLLVTACGGPILANPPLNHGSAPSLGPTRPPAADPQPIRLPSDDGPHDRLTEWWYYTGHLVDGAGAHYGFEYVIFRAERGSLPVSWAAHLAITDETGRRFFYTQRSEIGPQVDRSTGALDPGTTLDVGLGGPSQAPGVATPGASPGIDPTWTMVRTGDTDRLIAGARPEEAAAAGSPTGFGIDLTARTDRPAVLHDGDGWIDFGPSGGSYYYSRPSMDVAGRVVVDGRMDPVSGTAWFDHQWGDFISVGGGGWDWFAVNLADGTDLTLSRVRAADGTLALVWGTLVDPTGAVRHLDRAAFTVSSSGSWTSARTGATYPSGWRIDIPGENLRIDLSPTVADQELDTRPTTGVVYWEGSQIVHASRAGVPIGGQGYVELTGYAR